MKTSYTTRILAAWCILSAAAHAAATVSFPGPERLNVLLVSEPHGLPGAPAAEHAYLESLGSIRCTTVPVPHDGGDHSLDVDGLMGRDPRYIPLRKAALLDALRKDWDAIFFRPGRAVRHVDEEVQDALAAAVRRGQTLFWFAGRLASKPYPCVHPPLEELLPFQVDDDTSAAPHAGVNPIANLPLRDAGLTPPRRGLPAGNGFSVLQAVPMRKQSIPLVTYRRFGSGAVIGIQAGGGLFPSFGDAAWDGEHLWADALERLIRFAAAGKAPPPLRLRANAAETVSPDGSLTLTLELTGPAGLSVRIDQDDQRGTGHTLVPSVTLAAGTNRIEAVTRPSPYPHQFLRAVPLEPGTALPAAAVLRVPTAVGLELETTIQGDPPEFATRTHYAVQAGAFAGDASVCIEVRDWAMRPVHAERRTVDLANGAAEGDIDFVMDDPDPRAYVAWVRVWVADEGATVLAAAESTLYRYRPFDVTEQLHVATWHTEGGTRLRGYAGPFLRHLKDLGFTSVFGARDIENLERHNLRLYMEHQAATTLGVRAAPFRAAIEGYAERYQKEGERRVVNTRSGTGDRTWPTAALNLFSMGEESGYGRWSECYPWRNKEEAPEECNKWFRHYLQQVYSNDLSRLNAAWGRSFADWSELKVWKKYAEPFGWMFRAPPRSVDANVTPYVDTHAFHEWYFEEYAQNMMIGLRRATPVPTWTLSYDFTFIQYPPTPLSNFYCALPPECVAVWHAFVRSRTPAPNNPFHLDWMYYEDEAMNNQFLRMGFALGCTYLSTWGHVFNGDLTPTRPGMVIARTMHELARPEAVVRSMQPFTDPRIGIYTYDSRWKLVRGRYGFFLHRRGPNDISMGPGPYKAPGASYLKPAEGPLYTALTESGYAPRYVRPDEFAQCRILFLPYVEAIEADVARKLEQYVQDGGTLVAFPVLAQYDGGGKPFPRYPGAGLDELFGFTAEREWIYGRAPVDFPGENAARKAFADAWFNTSGVERTDEAEAQALERDTPLFFNMTMRCGGDPCHYLPEAHERLTALADDVVVVGRHEDGEPLLTYREMGAGRAVCFNVLLTWPSGLQIPVTEQRETFRQAVDQLVRRFGLEPDFELLNARGYGEGVVDFVTAQYRLPGAPTRILSMFSDWRSRPSSARLALKPPFTAVWDVLAGRRLAALPDPASGRPETLVTVDPGEWRLLALVAEPPALPRLDVPARASQGAALQVRPARPHHTLYGYIQAWPGESGSPPGSWEHHARSVVVAPGDPLHVRLRLDDPTGPWTLRYTDAITDVSVDRSFDVTADPAARLLDQAPAYPEAPLVSHQRARRGPALTDAEFLALVDRLAAIHLDPAPLDKRAYSAFTYELGNSRQDCNRRLSCVDWTARVSVLRDHVKDGAFLFFVGEDLGLDPRSGLSTTPARRPRILDAMQRLTESRGADLLRVRGAPHLRVVRLGKGRIVLDRRSPDSSGNSNLHLADWHDRWRSEIAGHELLPDAEAPELLPAGEERLRSWFIAP